MNNKPKLRQTKCFFIMCMSAERAEIYGQLLQYTATYNTTFSNGNLHRTSEPKIAEL